MCYDNNVNVQFVTVYKVQFQTETQAVVVD